MIYIHKYPKIKRIGEEENEGMLDNENDIISIQEKVDGANFRFTVDESGRIWYGSRNRVFDETPSQFRRTCEYVEDKLKSNPKTWDYRCYTFYGESMSKHTINYDWDRIPVFIGFDVMTPAGVFLDAIDAKYILEQLGLSFVNVLYYGTVADMPEELDVPKSMYYNGNAEGYVIKNARTQQYAKYVSKSFKEKNEEVFKNNSNDNDANVFLNRYCTDMRIEKMVHKLANEHGMQIEMPLMRLLPHAVYADIVEEEWRDILFSNLKINLKTIRKLVARKCAKKLEQMLSY